VYHDWSADGNWLVSDLSNAEETQFNIGLMNWNTKALVLLTDSTYHFQQSPNFVWK
jgi:TolB protein